MTPEAGDRISLRVRIATLIAVVGPGIITANVDNDAGGITTYSQAGAGFGYTLLWSLVPITLMLILVQEMCNRMGVVTGKGLSDLIRERFGVKPTFYLMLAMVVTNFGNIMAEFAGVKASTELFGLPAWLTVPTSAVFVWLLIVKGNYKTVEKVFLVACVFYVAYVITGFKVGPPIGEVLHQVAVPGLPKSAAGWTMLVGLVGTTIAPWMQFYQQASVAEKGIKIQDYFYSRIDTVVGCVVVNVIALFIIVCCAATLYPRSLPIESAADAAKALEGIAGEYAGDLFAFGLLNASLFAASILPLSTAYSVCEGLGFETGVDKKFSEAPQFYGLYTFLIVFGAGVIMIPGTNPVKVMYISQIVNGIMLPFVLVFMLLLVNNKKIMGDRVNGRVFNVLAWIATIVIIALDVVFLWQLILGYA
ncbi:MAG: Nramp family divalent metal transporter [Planctomycetes bacterium]|nr:Nramp family divalent metal transporter [Planctomycetota bacterium]MBI3846065.1 Nramp family divalent metal transporter [Planctomycetota bacterium]